MKPVAIITKQVKKKSLDLEKQKENQYQYPFDINELTSVYTLNPYHSQCIDIKALNILGDGLSDDVMDILDDITPKECAFTTLYNTIKDLQLYGNAYWEIVKLGASGYQIFHIPAQTMTKIADGYKQIVGEKTAEFKADQIYHFKYSTPLSTIYGAPDYLSIIPQIRLFEKIYKYNDKFFDNNAIPDMAMLVKGGDMSSNAIYSIRSFFREKFQGVENAHKLLYLPVKEGMDVEFKKLQADVKDASFQEQLKQAITDIIARHGVPPRLISIVNQGQLGGGGETIGQLEIFYKTMIKPKQRIISGLLKDLNKKHKIFNEDTEFDFIPLEFTGERKESPIESILNKM